MMKIFKFIVIGLKFWALGAMILFGLSYFDTSVVFYKQHIAVWLCVYTPCLFGYERIINIIFSKD